MVGLHPTSFVTLFGELLLLGVLAASSSVWARESKNVYLAGTTVAGAILVNGIWIWLLRDTFSRKQAWPQISDWQNLFFWAVWVGAVLGIALQLSRFFPSPFEKSRVWRERADFFGWLSMINVGLFLFSDRVGIFPVANIRYTISILPVVFLAWGLKVGTSASRWGAWAISGGALAGLIWVPQPHWQSQGIKWDDSPNWMAQAVFRGTVAQMRNENWQAACETINQESAGHMVTVFLFSNLLEDRFWTNELTTDDPAILNSRTFPVQPFLGTKTNIQILPKPTLVGPRFSKEELEKQLRQDSKKRLFLLIRGEPTTVNDILRELLMIASSSRIHLSIREREVDLVPGHLRLFELTVDPAIRDGTRIMEPKDGFQATSLVGL